MPHKITNAEIARKIKEIALCLEMDGVPYKPRAYHEVAETIHYMDRELSDLYSEGGLKALKNLPAVGEAISKKLETLILRGKLPYYDTFKRKYPIDVISLTAIEGIGPKIAKTLYQKLKIKTVTELESALLAHKVSKLSGFGEKIESNIARALAFHRKNGERFLLGVIHPRVEVMANQLRAVTGVKRLEIAGSIRRMKETIGDLDLIAVANNPKKLNSAFISLPGVADVLAKGKTKTMIRFGSGLDADLRIVPEKSFGAALLYFSGSRTHNIDLRARSRKMGYKLNEYGLFTNDKHKRFIAGRTEKEIYEALGLAYIAPELREMPDIIKQAQKHKLPRLINYSALQGDLQIQTTWSDGKGSIEEMAFAAREAGLSYIAITDHTHSLKITGGLDEKRLREQMKEIDKLNKFFNGKPRILKSAEVNILSDGRLDLPDSILAKLDIVGASVHTHFHLSKKEQTARIIKAMENPHIDILFHPTGRLLQRREPYEIDFNEIIRAAVRTGTVLEINSQPARLDLHDALIREALATGVRFAINSDAHEPAHFSCLLFGVGQARRAGATSASIINAHPLAKMLSLLKDGKRWAKKSSK